MINKSNGTHSVGATYQSQISDNNKDEHKNLVVKAVKNRSDYGSSDQCTILIPSSESNITSNKKSSPKKEVCCPSPDDYPFAFLCGGLCSPIFGAILLLVGFILLKTYYLDGLLNSNNEDTTTMGLSNSTMDSLNSTMSLSNLARIDNEASTISLLDIIKGISKVKSDYANQK